MGTIKKLGNWFFKGLVVIANSKVVVVATFCFVVCCVYKVSTYREEIDSYKREDLSEKTYVKEESSTKYYFDDIDSGSDVSKDIAASSLVSCINSKIDLDNLSSEILSNIDDINNLFNENDDYFSFYYKDIYTGFSVSYNADAPIFTASTIKAPAMIYLYEMASKGQINLTEELTYTENFYSSGSGILKTKEFGTTYDIDTLINYAIYYSDNAAYAMLANRFGRENFLEFWQEKGTKKIFTYDSIWGVTSASDASIYMQELYNFYLTDDTYGNKLMDMFKDSQWKMISNKNREFNTANKIGYSNKIYHDAAIVFESNPYILVVMSNTGEDESEYTYLFEKASKLVGTLHSNYWEYKIQECNKIDQY